MIYNIIYIAIWMISVLVTVALFELMLKWLYSIEVKNDVFPSNIVIIRNNQENIEYVLRRIVLIYNLNFKNSNLPTVCFNSSIDNETKKICILIAKNFDYVKFTDV